jgi:hypothetical protein
VSGVLQGPVRPDVRLWRIEHETRKVGPFNVEVTGSSPLGTSWEWDREQAQRVPYQWRPAPHWMPTLWSDETRRLCTREFGSRGRFAFWGLSPIREFFCGHAIAVLAARRFVLRSFRVPWDAHSRFRVQATFDVSRAQVLETLPLTAIFWA